MSLTLSALGTLYEDEVRPAPQRAPVQRYVPQQPPQQHFSLGAAPAPYWLGAAEDDPAEKLKSEKRMSFVYGGLIGLAAGWLIFKR